MFGDRPRARAHALERALDPRFPRPASQPAAEDPWRCARGCRRALGVGRALERVS